MYRLVRPLLFSLDAEKAHEYTLQALHYIPNFFFKKIKPRVVNVMGLLFSHPIGLAAGLDKNGEHIDALAKLGFSFIEVGTVTPRPQEGNPRPRLFRLPKDGAIINRMGFNNQGVDVLVENLKKTKFKGIIGVNIGKNKDTTLPHAIDDYLYCLNRVYSYSSYVTINVSSPNTPNLRALQHGDYFKHLLSSMRTEQLRLADQQQRYVPLVVKLSPDESDDTLRRMADVILANQIDGIIATNTTCARDAISNTVHKDEIGGLSGRPLLIRSTNCLRVLKQVVGDEVALIGVGGIDSQDCARRKYEAGASLLQVYTGLIYQGPSLIHTLEKRSME